MQIKSILEQISTQVFQAKTLLQGQQIFLKCLDEHNIKQEDKNKLIDGVNGCKTLLRLQQFLCNSLLKYKGMSLNIKQV